MIQIKHIHIKTDDKEYNVYEESDKSVTIICPTEGRDINIAANCLSQLVSVLRNIENTQNHYDW